MRDRREQDERVTLLASHFDPFDAQQFAESKDFLLEFTDQFSISVFIDDGLADDLLGTIRVSGKFWNEKQLKSLP